MIERRKQEHWTIQLDLTERIFLIANVVKWSSRIFHLCSIKLNYTLVNPSKLKNLISDWEKMCYRKKGAWCGIIIILSTSFWNWSKKSEI